MSRAEAPDDSVVSPRRGLMWPFSESFLQMKGTEYPRRDLTVMELCLLGRASPPDAFSVRISLGLDWGRVRGEGLLQF